jgi:hypothetical protein
MSESVADMAKQAVGDVPGARSAVRPMHHLRTTCRACGGTDMSAFLELGPTPLANSFPATPDDYADET